ncbi:hypothetical protein TRIATDRAFT_302289 [Trichoderma atroviride IMI 206040]|uniref:Uncharacterized protein n=1 Tax=Hypocrea atroviridis (strain ATCC 20476 / IMI 206040) TaxID=452589 RepID=G9P4A2_HYPAI|nr:uncharacterized protein TRIATDRAFT_302289 [Trichoderma atroviride IMI 206040]EHK41945.1 hypothetical protein TRIATDRAFT_302289 [Trichoderma atroviride IMI 206040]
MPFSFTPLSNFAGLFQIEYADQEQVSSGLTYKYDTIAFLAEQGHRYLSPATIGMPRRQRDNASVAKLLLNCRI